MAVGELGHDGNLGLRRLPNPLALAWLGLFALIGLAAATITLFGNPHAGDPVIRLALPAWTSPQRATPASLAANTPPAPPALPSAIAPVLPPALVPHTISTAVYAGTALIADPALIEATPSGPLPRIASDGRTPMRAYAGAVPPVALADRHIALVIAGLGISAKQTSAAINGLPEAVTLAFAPYASDVQRWAGEARRQGHEVLVQVPMEPVEFPDRDPGPHTLRSGQSEDSNSERLVWALTRFTGYTGVANLEGGRFLADADSLEPVMRFLASRGLLFFDDGRSARSVAPRVAQRTGETFAQGVTAIDKIDTAMEIDRQLAALEASARGNGSAAGSGNAAPVTVERVALWARGLEARGFELVPASAIVPPAKNP